MFMLRVFLLGLCLSGLLSAANLDYAQAKKYLQDGHYDEAYRVFGYVGANRRHLRPYCDYYRALASYQAGQTARATAILERYITQENIPYLDEALELLNDCYLALDRAPEIHPLAAYKKVGKLFAKSQYPEALRLLDAVSANAQMNDLPEDVYYYQARAYMYCAEPDRARRILLARAGAGSVYYLGVLALHTRQTALALQRFNEVVQKYPAAEYAPLALYNLARYTRGENSLRHYQRLYRDYPDSRYADDAAWEVGSVYFQQKNYQRAAAVFLEGYGLDRYSDNADSLLYWAGKSYQKLRRAKDAELIFQQATREFPARFYGWRAAQQLGITPVIPSDNVQLADIKPQTDRALLELVKLGEYADALAEARLLTDHNKQERISTALRIYLAHAAYRSGSYLDAINLSAGVLADAERTHDHTVLAPPELWRICFPQAQAELVRANAAKNKLPVNYVYALIREESRFDEKALSPANAYGLMQLIPATALQVLRQEQILTDGFAPEILRRPDLNILLGTVYLRQMLEQFGDNQYLALAAYNAGPTAAARWLRQHGGLKNFDIDIFVESIAYTETRNYVKRVMRGYWLYELIYGVLEST
ncbi:MAG: transglycosylase SLT domain-containing protein [Candidatus Margulisbacteria bacterium]|jgi:soluble lytic murein transglycosylase-like protein/outer membrane protein assembly factor BamD (BamD/ComL family)|nr:transglycosylase SLT domain-containing protein [Candidatus Margulisiibacteriota bacterium]